MTGELPWSIPTRQEQGGKTEKKIAKKRGARLHPRSGAGRIKDDMSTESDQIECKDANKTYQLKATELEVLRRHAVQRGKDPVFLIYFHDQDLTVELHIRKGMG